MKTSLVAAAVAVLSLTAAPKISAQVVVSRPATPVTAIGTPVYYSSAYVAPYSYYVALPRPARGYVPYGASDTFAFYGNPYGRPNDPWTWPYMSGGNYGNLARYYYPPVR
jgi:hypothetical protein